ncbi:MAG: hypothetical protein AVDCRST_MAG11-1624, partial [uncultured Gemmatimonadaceae bacterium]
MATTVRPTAPAIAGAAPARTASRAGRLLPAL